MSLCTYSGVFCRLHISEWNYWLKDTCLFDFLDLTTLLPKAGVVVQSPVAVYWSFLGSKSHWHFIQCLFLPTWWWLWSRVSSQLQCVFPGLGRASFNKLLIKRKSFRCPFLGNVCLNGPSIFLLHGVLYSFETVLYKLQIHTLYQLHVMNILPHLPPGGQSFHIFF